MGITRYVLPVVIGAMCGMILIKIGERGIENIYPLPPGTDKYDVDSLAKAFRTMPQNAFIFYLVNNAAASLIAGIVSTLIANRTAVLPAIIVGIVLSLTGIYYAAMLPQPLWFSVVSIILYMPFVYLGYLVSRKRVSAEKPGT